MIYVVASIKVKKTSLQSFIQIFKANVPRVLAEKGCVEYVPTLDFPTGFPPQILDDLQVTIVEKWETIEDLEAHLAAPHMLEYKEKVKDMVERVELKVLQAV